MPFGEGGRRYYSPGIGKSIKVNGSLQPLDRKGENFGLRMSLGILQRAFLNLKPE
jgi:hypothetical protein